MGYEIGELANHGVCCRKREEGRANEKRRCGTPPLALATRESTRLHRVVGVCVYVCCAGETTFGGVGDRNVCVYTLQLSSFASGSGFDGFGVVQVLVVQG